MQTQSNHQKNKAFYQLVTYLLAALSAVGGRSTCADKDRALQHGEQLVREAQRRGFFFSLFFQSQDDSISWNYCKSTDDTLCWNRFCFPLDLNLQWISPRREIYIESPRIRFWSDGVTMPCHTGLIHFALCKTRSQERSPFILPKDNSLFVIFLCLTF